LITTHTLRVLEYDRVLRLIADEARSAAGRERVLRRAPLADPELLEREQAHVQEALTLAGSAAGFPSVAHDDLGEILARVRVGGAVLDPDELTRVGRALRVVREVKVALTDGEQVGPILRDHADALTPSRDLESRISHTIGPSGDVLDSASPKLAKLRRQNLSMRETVRRRLEGLFQTLDLSKDSDEYVTFRSGRYVIPVLASDRGKAPGIVHDQSGSGRTFFVEPFAVVEENNALARCQAEILEEERRILAELTARVADFAVPMATNAEVLGVLDEVGAVAAFSVRHGLTVPELDRSSTRIRLVRARHPVMVAEAEDVTTVVPLELDLGEAERILILTGPNMGGKTVALKTIGLAVLMASSGLPVVADPGTIIPFVRTVAADIGDEQSISENLSTFASHLKHLGEFLLTKDDPALVLLDELGTGTDPSEGGALARAYLEALDGPGVRIVATTHLTQLKEFAADHPSAVNGSMAFDETTLRSRFTLDLGSPGRSRAFEVAERLQFPPSVLARARGLVSEEERRMDRLLAEVESARERAREAEGRAAEAREEAERHLVAAAEREERAREQIAQAREKASLEAERILREADTLVKETRKKLTGVTPPRAPEVEAVGREVRERRQEAQSARARSAAGDDAERAPVDPDAIGPGVRLWSLDLGSVVEALERVRGRSVHVMKGGIRFEVAVERLRGMAPGGTAAGRAGSPGDEGRRSRGVSMDVSADTNVPTELDLRGLDGAEAVDTVEHYLDRALMANLGVVRIIHGKGAGVLRRRVREVLGTHFGVLKSRPGEPGEGGEGVTVVQLGDA
jgi:DNA mismatch repair protein MutS2